MLIQKTILSGVVELLYTNDFVVIPGFGGFVSRPQMAHYSLNQEILFPPSKSIMFNIQLKQNDGVLANWLKDKINCDFITASKHLEEFSDHCKLILQTKLRLEFENLGVFFLDFEKNICFEPKVDVNFLIDSYGLSSVTLNELEPLDVKETIAKAPKIETKDRFVKVEVQTPPHKQRNYKRIAMLAIGIPVVAFAMLFAVNQIQSNSNSFSNLLGGNSCNSSYVPTNYTTSLNKLEINSNPNYVVDANGYADIVLFENKHVVVNVSAVSTESHSISHTKRSHTIANAHAKYQVVLGCFGIKANAKKLIKKLAQQNIEASISGTNSNGLFVVSAGGFNEKESAITLLQSIKTKQTNAWIMTQD